MGCSKLQLHAHKIDKFRQCTHPVKYTTYALDTLVLPETTFVLLGALTLVKSVHPEHVRVRVLVGVPSGVCENPIQLEPAWS